MARRWTGKETVLYRRTAVIKSCLRTRWPAEIVYDATVKFCKDLLDRRDRTVDQMVQAARSGKQNIAEGSMASGTSKETEIKLTNVVQGEPGRTVDRLS